MKKRLVVAVTNDLTFDQRMIRICHSLAASGYSLTLVGRKFKKSVPLSAVPYHQKRLASFFEKGKLSYLEYNVRLFFYLLFEKADIVCAVDLDTIVPCYIISRIKGAKRVYDAHELFCEMKEVVTRPFIYKMWKKVEKFTVPSFKNGYTVSHFISDEFKKMYEVNYETIRNLPILQRMNVPEKIEKFILSCMIRNSMSRMQC